MDSTFLQNWHDAFHWGLGRGFWYMDPLDEVKDVTAQQLLWTPAEGMNCALWHVGDIAYSECFHVGHMLQGRVKEAIPHADLFSYRAKWMPGEQLLQSLGSIDDLKRWVRQVRRESHDFIDSLSDDDYHDVPASSSEGNSVARVLMQTIGHTGVHIGCIQWLRRIMFTGSLMGHHGRVSCRHSPGDPDSGSTG